MIPSLERWPTKAKEAPSPHEVRLAPLDTNPVFQNLEGKHNSKFQTEFMIQFQGNVWVSGKIKEQVEGQIYGQTLFHRTLSAADRCPNKMIDIIYWFVLQHMKKTFKEILQAPVVTHNQSFGLLFDVILKKTMK